MKGLSALETAGWTPPFADTPFIFSACEGRAQGPSRPESAERSLRAAHKGDQTSHKRLARSAEDRTVCARRVGAHEAETQTMPKLQSARNFNCDDGADRVESQSSGGEGVKGRGCGPNPRSTVDYPRIKAFPRWHFVIHAVRRLVGFDIPGSRAFAALWPAPWSPSGQVR